MKTHVASKSYFFILENQGHPWTKDIINRLIADPYFVQRVLLRLASIAWFSFKLFDAK